MNFKSVAATAAVLLGASATAAFAQTNAPVTIVSSQAQPQIADAGENNQQGVAGVTFVNTNIVPATEVDFTLSSNGAPLATYRDIGSFAPNVRISHSFANDQTARDQQLSVARVTFADGSVWLSDNRLPAGQLASHSWLSTPE